MIEHGRKLLVVTDWPLRDGWELDFLTRTLLREGVYASQISWCAILTGRPPHGLIRRAPSAELTAGADAAKALSADCGTVLALGDFACELFTGRTGIDKWQSSVLHSGGKCIIPCYPMSRVSQDLSLQVWVSLACRKAAAELKSPIREKQYDFLLNPPLEETLEFLREAAQAELLSVDIETGRGQINTVGFAISPTRAIAINVLPDRLAAQSHHRLWSDIARLLESDQPKVLQNFIYEQQFFSRYGIRLCGVRHDTMIAQKFLWPELEMGLDAVGRMYTDMPYWKDDGKSWNNIRDWEAHYRYNCLDTAGTLMGQQGQLRDLKTRNLLPLWQGYITKLFPLVTEMCSWGIPVSEPRLLAMRSEVDLKITALNEELKREAGAEKLNAASPAQVKKFLQAKGYALPKKRDAKTKTWKESTDEKSLKKLRTKHPGDESITTLLKLAKLRKASSSYLNFTYSDDKRMRFTLNCHGTETGRWSGYCDPWGNGVNPQTVPGGGKGLNIKSLFEASPGYVFLECDLRQAESRFVAYDCADLNLIQALEDPTRDIHSEVATEICLALGKDPATEKQDKANWKQRWRQLGKKSGHGANYSMQGATFIDSCIQEMDLVLTRTEADKILEAYHKLFPGIRLGHARLRRELAQTRMLRTPLGRERYFYGRMDDATFRQAYAYRPQSTIPDIVNHLILFLCAKRERGELDFRLLLQCHDSLLLEVPENLVSTVSSACALSDEWAPKIILPGGQLRIPTEVKTAKIWGLCE
jgi:DNA polymerase-1